MKKTKLLTSLAALALVLSLGACEVNVDVGGDVTIGGGDSKEDDTSEETTENTSEEESTSENTSEDDTKENTSEDNTSESTTEGGTTEGGSEDETTSEFTSEDNTSEDTSENTGNENDEIISQILANATSLCDEITNGELETWEAIYLEKIDYDDGFDGGEYFYLTEKDGEVYGTQQTVNWNNITTALVAYDGGYQYKETFNTSSGALTGTSSSVNYYDLGDLLEDYIGALENASSVTGELTEDEDGYIVSATYTEGSGRWAEEYTYTYYADTQLNLTSVNAITGDFDDDDEDEWEGTIINIKPSTLSEVEAKVAEVGYESWPVVGFALAIYITYNGENQRAPEGSTLYYVEDGVAEALYDGGTLYRKFFDNGVSVGDHTYSIVLAADGTDVLTEGVTIYEGSFTITGSSDAYAHNVYITLDQPLEDYLGGSVEDDVEKFEDYAGMYSFIQETQTYSVTLVYNVYESVTYLYNNDDYSLEAPEGWDLDATDDEKFATYEELYLGETGLKSSTIYNMNITEDYEIMASYVLGDDGEYSLYSEYIYLNNPVEGEKGYYSMYKSSPTSSWFGAFYSFSNSSFTGWQDEHGSFNDNYYHYINSGTFEATGETVTDENGNEYDVYDMPTKNQGYLDDLGGAFIFGAQSYKKGGSMDIEGNYLDKENQTFTSVFAEKSIRDFIGDLIWEDPTGVLDEEEWTYPTAYWEIDYDAEEIVSTIYNVGKEDKEAHDAVYEAFEALDGRYW